MLANVHGVLSKTREMAGTAPNVLAVIDNQVTHMFHVFAEDVNRTQVSVDAKIV